MIDLLHEWLEGRFCNKIQAFSYPSRYAMIQVTHKKISDTLFYGEQAYNYRSKKPYRQFVLEPQLLDDGRICILNYDIENKRQFENCRGIDKITRDMLQLKQGCNVYLTYDGTKFVGGLTGCDCYVKWNGRDTYLQNEIELTSDTYRVKDLGFDQKHHHQIWGSKYDHFEFKRLPK